MDSMGISGPLDQAFGPFKKRIKTHSHTWHGTVKNIESGKKLDQYSMMTDAMMIFDEFEKNAAQFHDIVAAMNKFFLSVNVSFFSKCVLFINGST